jgi:hypothetical protein
VKTFWNVSVAFLEIGAISLIRAFPRRVLTGTDKAKSIPTPIPETSFSVFYGYRDL